MSAQLTPFISNAKCLYINLTERTDRNAQVLEQLCLIGITEPIRFNAIRHKNGAVGCTQSHIECLKIAKENGWPYVIVVEDDILFLNPNRFLNNCDALIREHPIDSWDVVLIAGNNAGPYKQLSPSCVRVSGCQTTTGYIVKSEYYDTLIDNFESGLKSLLNVGVSFENAIDKYWFRLQRRDMWLLIVPLTVTQVADYSDIEKRETNYTRSMLTLDKTKT
jgi:GR25 family glycosyltransferase involved in LPS biosynthesis